jgi:hypothetical protein
LSFEEIYYHIMVGARLVHIHFFAGQRFQVFRKRGHADFSHVVAMAHGAERGVCFAQHMVVGVGLHYHTYFFFRAAYIFQQFQRLRDKRLS